MGERIRIEQFDFPENIDGKIMPAANIIGVFAPDAATNSRVRQLLDDPDSSFVLRKEGDTRKREVPDILYVPVKQEDVDTYHKLGMTIIELETDNSDVDPVEEVINTEEDQVMESQQHIMEDITVLANDIIHKTVMQMTTEELASYLCLAAVEEIFEGKVTGPIINALDRLESTLSKPLQPLKNLFSKKKSISHLEEDTFNELDTIMSPLINVYFEDMLSKDVQHAREPISVKDAFKKDIKKFFTADVMKMLNTDLLELRKAELGKILETALRKKSTTILLGRIQKIVEQHALKEKHELLKLKDTLGQKKLNEDIIQFQAQKNTGRQDALENRGESAAMISFLEKSAKKMAATAERKDIITINVDTMKDLTWQAITEIVENRIMSEISPSS